MTASGNRAKIEDVLAEFESRQDLLAAFCAKTKSLIEVSLQDANIRYQFVQARVKTKKKLKEKYLDENKGYTCLDDITDQAGLRVITYYEDEVDRVAEVIKREFDIDAKRSVDKRITEPDRFSYRALNYVCKHLEKRATDVEDKKYAGTYCEIKVTSILSHAWSEIEHEWYDLRDAYPDNIKRRFSRLAALLELAESEFLDIRKTRTQYVRSVELRVEAGVPDLAVDAVSLRTFIEQEPLVAALDQLVAQVMGASVANLLPDEVVEGRARAATLAGMSKLQDVRDRLAQHQTALLDFLRRCYEELWPKPPVGFQASKGISIFHLGLLLTSSQGTEATVE